jgi:hypothetical protein
MNSKYTKRPSVTKRLKLTRVDIRALTATQLRAVVGGAMPSEGDARQCETYSDNQHNTCG